MNDPFDQLRGELVRAAARVEVAAPRRRWVWLRSRSHPAAVVIAALVICGSAAAAVVSLTASPSQPLSGQIPGRITPNRGQRAISVAGHRYSIQVTPDLSTGSAGWAVWTQYQGPPFGSGGGGGGGGGGFPTLTAPIFQGSGVPPWSVPTGAQTTGDSVGFVITGPQVAAVRIRSRNRNRPIRTFSSPLLPAGDRAAVFFIPADGPIPVVGPQSAQPTGYRIRAAGHNARPRWRTVPTTPVTPLNSSGHPLPTNPPVVTDSRHGLSFWQGHTAPRAGACELTQHSLPGLTAKWGSTITRIPTVTSYVGELFVSCVSTKYYLHGWPMTAAVLLDARHPGTDSVPSRAPSHSPATPAWSTTQPPTSAPSVRATPGRSSRAAPEPPNAREYYKPSRSKRSTPTRSRPDSPTDQALSRSHHRGRDAQGLSIGVGE